MSVPYQCVTALGNSGILAAARGTSIFTFAANGGLIASWEHPATQRKAVPAGNETIQSGADPVERDEGSSPTKRRKVETDAGVQAVAAKEEEQAATQPSEAKGNDQKKSTRRGRHATRPSDHKGPEQPYVILLTATSDGAHLVAVTGTDKAVWVFEHDGLGQLKEFDPRSMPKRPCDLALTADNKTILVADKFGDVYSLPLVPSDDQDVPEVPKVLEAPASKGANALTVHSQRNRLALLDQERQRQKNPQPKTKEAPKFVHELLIGHVSMLTSVVVAEAEGKPYILTADRDEHIRVSRGIPQAYVIENFCLGHKAFVNALCLPRADVLVSGGGDDELYVWDWKAGVLKEKVDLLSHVQQVVPETSRVAVSRLVSSGDGLVVVTCERVPAVFIFQFQESNLAFAQTLKLDGNALDLAFIAASEKRLIVSVDIADENNGTTSSPLAVFKRSTTSRWESSDMKYEDTDVSGTETSRADLEKVLYAVENLRKSDNPYAEDDGGETPAQESEGASTPANA